MMVPIRMPMVNVTRIVRVYARRLAFKRTQKALARWSIVNFLQKCVLKIIPCRHLQVIQLRRAEEITRTGLINDLRNGKASRDCREQSRRVHPERVSGRARLHSSRAERVSGRARLQPCRPEPNGTGFSP